jgi:hypothetical protein
VLETASKLTNRFFCAFASEGARAKIAKRKAKNVVKKDFIVMIVIVIDRCYRATSSEVMAREREDCCYKEGERWDERITEFKEI